MGLLVTSTGTISGCPGYTVYAMGDPSFGVPIYAISMPTSAAVGVPVPFTIICGHVDGATYNPRIDVNYLSPVRRSSEPGELYVSVIVKTETMDRHLFAPNSTLSKAFGAPVVTQGAWVLTQPGRWVVMANNDSVKRQFVGFSGLDGFPEVVRATVDAVASDIAVATPPATAAAGATSAAAAATAASTVAPPPNGR